MVDKATIENDLPLKGRSREVYLDLCNYIEELPEDCSLPSLRELQRKYSAGQQTVVNALKLLDKNKKLVRIPRKKVKVTAKKSVNSLHNLWANTQAPWVTNFQATEVVLAMTKAQAITWQPIVDDFNLHSQKRIKIEAFTDIKEISNPATFLRCDFALFQTNPISLGIINNTSSFMDIKELTKEIDSDRLAKSAFIHDPSGRLWGVAPSLNSEIIFRNREIDSSDCLEGHKDWEWDGFIKYADYLRDRNPDLPYICLLNGYISYLFNNGVTFVNPDTGKVNINYDSVAKPLEVLRDMIKHKITPVYSDLFNSNLFEQILSSKQIACWSGWNNQIEMMSERVNDFDILPFPANSNCKRAVYSELFSIMSDSMNYNVCWEFIKYALSSDVQKKLVDSNNCFPVCKDIKPKIFSKKQFDFLSNYIDQCERRIEDYYIPFQSFFVIETGIDRWIKHGGKLNIVLKDIEHSCQWHIDNYVLKNNN